MKVLKKIIHVYFRHYILSVYTIILNNVYGMNIHRTARISLKAKIDKTNPSGINIEEGSYVAFGAVLLTHDMSRGLNKEVYIGKNCFIGANSIVLPGVKIGDSCIVAAGSVVTKNVSSNCIVAGNPAVVIKKGIVTKALGIIVNGE